MLAFCSSEEMTTLVRRMRQTDPDPDVRTCAYYVLKALKARPGKPKFRR